MQKARRGAGLLSECNFRAEDACLQAQVQVGVHLDLSPGLESIHGSCDYRFPVDTPGDTSGIE